MNARQFSQIRLKFAPCFRDHVDRRGAFDPRFPARLVLGNPASLQRAGAEHFVLAENFEGGGGHAGDSNRLAQCVEDFDGISLCAVRGYVMIHQFHDVATTETMLQHIALQHYICVEFELPSALRLSM